MSYHDFNTHQAYLEKGLTLPIVVFHDHNYLRIKGQNDINKFKSRVMKVTKAASAALYEHFKISLHPYFYPVPYNYQTNRTIYDWETGTFSCTGYLKNTLDVLEQFYTVSRPILRHKNYIPYKVVQPIGILFSSCADPQTKGWAYVNGAFRGMSMLKKDELESVASVTIFSNPDVEEYEEAYTILHEFGHAFGSEHDDEKVCGSSFPRYIMCPYAHTIPESKKKKGEIDLTWLKFSSDSIKNITTGLHTAKSLMYARTLLPPGQDTPSMEHRFKNDATLLKSIGRHTAMSLLSTELRLNDFEKYTPSLFSNSTSFSYGAYDTSRYTQKHSQGATEHIHLSIFFLFVQGIIILAMFFKSKHRIVTTQHD